MSKGQDPTDLGIEDLDLTSQRIVGIPKPQNVKRVLGNTREKSLRHELLKPCGVTRIVTELVSTHGVKKLVVPDLQLQTTQDVTLYGAIREKEQTLGKIPEGIAPVERKKRGLGRGTTSASSLAYCSSGWLVNMRAWT